MQSFQHLSADALNELLTQGPVQIVDIRDERSFETGHIRGAQHLDNSTVQQFIDNADLDAPLVVCCYHGVSSQSAAAYLADRGFDEVYSLDGGFTHWAMAFPDQVER